MKCPKCSCLNVKRIGTGMAQFMCESCGYCWQDNSPQSVTLPFISRMEIPNPIAPMKIGETWKVVTATDSRLKQVGKVSEIVEVLGYDNGFVKLKTCDGLVCYIRFTDITQLQKIEELTA